ncbi:MAG: 4-alpha-glucanotransferase, partial [Rhodobacteraceae bacterium]|nr:4-alpha-glucanotransferase [Paracoccaceae bacterium]
QARAKAAGMPFGLYLDIAVGTHPHGAETWAERDLFAQGVSLGAPPDLLGPSGQRWGLAPMRPDMLRATGYSAFAQTLRAQLRFCGLLRIDHILGLERSFWLPDGLPGLYVTMPRDELLAVLRIEATRAGAAIIGEDLGTIPDGLRGALDASGVMGCRVAMFERDWEGTGAFLTPDAYTPTALASWGTHDLPTWQGWRQGRDIDWRAELGEIADPGAAHATRQSEVAAFDAVAGAADLEGLHRFLARAASTLVAVQGEDLAGAVEQCNLPGTLHEHPNWRRRLPLPLSGLISAPSLGQTGRIMHDAGRNG